MSILLLTHPHTSMIESTAFLGPMRSLGYTFYSGVPCSLLQPLINSVICHQDSAYIAAASEGEAIGITFGAFLAGRKTVTMCQNSGLGNMANPLTSLNATFKIPTLLITTWRGEPGQQDEPQHELMGQITHKLLDTLKIHWLPFPESTTEVMAVIEEADTYMQTRQSPFALVLREGTLTSSLFSEYPSHTLPTTKSYQQILAFNQPQVRLTRTQAIKQILDICVETDVVIATTGKTGRELFTLQDRPGNLYVVGGMGTASAIGLGIALSNPKQRVIVLDGDGAALMKLGTLATIGHYQPKNLLHIILDNETHDSTGGQLTASSSVSFAKVATAVNYKNAYAAENLQDIKACLTDSIEQDGPTMLHFKIRPGSPKILGRPSVKPPEVKARLTDFLATNASTHS